MNEINENFIFSNPCYLPIDDVADLDIETLDREFIVDIECSPLIFIENAYDGAIDIVLVKVEPLKQFFLSILRYFLPNGYPLVDKLIHHNNKLNRCS